MAARNKLFQLFYQCMEKIFERVLRVIQAESEKSLVVKNFLLQNDHLFFIISSLVRIDLFCRAHFRIEPQLGLSKTLARLLSVSPQEGQNFCFLDHQLNLEYKFEIQMICVLHQVGCERFGTTRSNGNKKKNFRSIINLG